MCPRYLYFEQCNNNFFVYFMSACMCVHMSVCLSVYQCAWIMLPMLILIGFIAMILPYLASLFVLVLLVASERNQGQAKQSCPFGKFCSIQANCSNDVTKCVEICTSDNNRIQGNWSTGNCEISKQQNHQVILFVYINFSLPLHCRFHLWGIYVYDCIKSFPSVVNPVNLSILLSFFHMK